MFVNLKHEGLFFLVIDYGGSANLFSMIVLLFEEV